MPGSYVLSKSDNGQYSFVLKAANGEVILRSEQYEAKASALAGVESVRKNSADNSRYERKQSNDARFYFNLKAANHQVIGTSQMYRSTDSRDAGIESVKTNGPGSPLNDTTS